MKLFNFVRLIVVVLVINDNLGKEVERNDDLEETKFQTPMPEQAKNKTLIFTGYEQWLEARGYPTSYSYNHSSAVDDEHVQVQSGTVLDDLVMPADGQNQQVQSPPTTSTVNVQAGTVMEGLVMPEASAHGQTQQVQSPPTTSLTQTENTDVAVASEDISTTTDTATTTDTTTAGTSTQTTTTDTTTAAAPAQTTATSDTYGQLLDMSYMFYEAQQSGPLPPFNRIEWRGDSNVGDAGPGGEDLTGGWHDAGDHLKFVMTIAYTANKLAWGFLEFQNGYSGYEETALKNIKFATDFLIKCHIEAAAEGPSNKFVAQVGNVIADHSFWGRPEDMTMERPTYVVDCDAPGTEPAALSSAALSAIALIYAESDAEYAQECLSHAMQLYAFASECQGKWTDSVKHQKSVYPSYAFADELALAAAWLYKVTREEAYLIAAQTHWNEALPDSGFSENSDWDNNFWSATMLLWELDAENQAIYEEKLAWFLERWVSPPDACPSSGDHSWGLCVTPGGLSFMAKWGALRHNMNAGLLAMIYAKKTENEPLRCWVKSQMDYIVGGDFSYVVGYGSAYPQKPHHRSSSCESTGPCGDADYTKAGPNPQILYGALVGGPTHMDTYEDNRDDYVLNEVAIDYNAGFTGVLAALRETSLAC